MSKVAVYSRVKLELLSKEAASEQLQVVVVPQADADFPHGLLGDAAPLGQAILGHSAGETIPYEKGDLYAIHLVEVEVAEDFDARQARQEKAEKESKIQFDFAKQQAAVFAASSTSKWGDYDPDGVKMWDEEEKKDP